MGIKVMRIPIIIPAYEPDERLITLLSTLVADDVYIIIVDDGSGLEFKELFGRAEEIIVGKGVLLRHDVNRGKGGALKTAFKYVLDNVPDAIGVITADSDGQHSRECIQAVRRALLEHPDSLVLGVRRFDGEGIPWKSRYGNVITLRVMKLISGINVSDTQTGLRGIPRAFLEELINVEGERFEFETRMLLATVNRYEIVEVPIETIYESELDHKTHFNPVMDSIKIYKVLFGKFFRYLFSSASSFVIDIVLFSILCMFLKNWSPVWYAAVSTVIARVASATSNYLMNYYFVFKSSEKKSVSAGKYVALAVAQMGASAMLVTAAIFVFAGVNEAVLKMVVDTVLFFVSYRIQKRFVF